MSFPKQTMNSKLVFPFLIQFVGLISVFLATSTIVVGGWIFFGQAFSHSSSSGDIHIPGSLEKCSQFYNNSGTVPWTIHPLERPADPINVDLAIKINSCKIFLEKYSSLMTTHAFAAGITAIVQFGAIVYLLAGSLEDFTFRARSWVIVNIGSNLVYIICFTSMKTFPIPLGSRGSEMLGLVKHLPGFIMILESNIFLGSFLLILVLLMMRYVRRSRPNYSSVLMSHHL